MKQNLVIILAVTLTLVGCGKGKKSSGALGTVTNQGMCSQATVDLYRDLVKQSERPITSRTRISEIIRNCETLDRTLAGGVCQDSSSHSHRDVRYLSYADVSNYCADIQTYAGPRNPPAPIPVPVEPTSRPRRYDNTLVENLDPRYNLIFETSHVTEDQKDIRNSQTRCQLSISDRANRNLRDARAKLVAATIQIYSGGATYDLSAALVDSHELVRLNCRSRDNRLNIQELNQLLNGVAEIRKR